MRLTEDTDVAELVDAALAGDAGAWPVIINKYDALVRGVARRHRLGAAQVDDVVQNTWVQLFKHLHSIRDPRCLAGWLVTTAARESLRLIRAQRREQAMDVTRTDVPERREGPEAVTVADDERARLHEAVARLPERYRELLELLMDTEQLSYSEIADRLDMPIGSIGPVRARGCAILRRAPEFAVDVAA